MRWDWPAVGVDRQIRACTPAPGAWTTFRGERVRIHPVEIAVGAEAVAPGELRVTRHDVLVGTASTPVRLGLVQPAGRRPMPAGDWSRGARLTSEDAFA